SSYLADDPADCSPARVIDGEIGTAWVEGVESNGVGESLTLELGVPTEVRNVAVLPGYCASPEVWRANGRPSRVRLEFSDGTAVEKALEDAPFAQVIYLDEARTVSWLRLTLLDVYPGERWADTAVSELTINYLEGY
ncbi:MAG: discoidin domain-containing protein, partial [bacterium]|nr:discoidin domain-containing protein [bacterium]